MTQQDAKIRFLPCGFGLVITAIGLLSFPPITSGASIELRHHRAINRNDDEAAEKATILDILNTQVACWNDGDIDGFMETYWKSPELTFSSGGQTTRGWQATIDRYKQRYSTRALMGHLTFDELEVTLLNDSSALVLGRWTLARDEDNPEGNFTLVLRRMDERWLIIHDHSSLEEETDEND